jgi:succinate dehydrogenase / fumarate reductase membrane anchor subunit
MKLATLLFTISLLLHSWVGMRDILMDYARPTSAPARPRRFWSRCSWWRGLDWAVQILWSV